MKSKAELKKYFENGDKPTQEQFWEWQESYWHKDEKIPMHNIGGLENGLPNGENMKFIPMSGTPNNERVTGSIVSTATVAFEAEWQSTEGYAQLTKDSGLQIGNAGSAEVIMRPSDGFSATKLYNPVSNKHYIQKGYLFENYYNQTQVNSLINRTYKVMGSVSNYNSLPTANNSVGDVWNLLNTGENFVWVDNINNSLTAGWDKLSGMFDSSNLASIDYVTQEIAKYIPLTGTSVLDGKIEDINGRFRIGKHSNRNADLFFQEYSNPNYPGRLSELRLRVDLGFRATVTGDGNIQSQLELNNGLIKENFFSIDNATTYTKDLNGFYASKYLIPTTDETYVQKKYVDQKSSYSSNEQITGGQWIDGKPIYKKTVKFDTIPSTGEIDLTSHFQDVETIVSNQMFTEWYNMDVAFAGNQYRGKAFITVQPEMAKIEYVPNIDYDYSMINSFTLTLEYTKRTI